MVRAQAKLNSLHEVEIIEQEIASSQAKQDSLEDSVDTLKERRGLARQQFKEMWHRRAQNYREFSLWLSMVYLLIALLLFLSDIPLSLRLVAKGFDLRTQLVDPDTNAVLLTVDDIIKQPWAVFSNLWEPLVLAVGIALAGVFIKYFLDEIIFSREADDQPSKQELTKERGQVEEVAYEPRLSEPLAETPRQETAGENDSPERRKRGRPTRAQVVLWAIFGLYLLAILLLGLFRADIQKKLQRDQFVFQQATLANRLRAQGVPEDRIQQIIDSQPKPAEESLLAIATFIALTLALPVVGGVCFSAGWRRFKNWQQFTGAKRAVARIDKRYEKLSEELNEVSETCKRHKQSLERIREKEQAQILFALNLYRHGYERGEKVPETIYAGESLYQYSQRVIQKFLAKRLQKGL